MEKVVVDQLRTLWGETDSLDPFQLRFRPCHGTETVLVALLYDLLAEADQGSLSYCSFWIFQQPLIPDLDIFLDRPMNLEIRGSVILRPWSCPEGAV